MTWLILIVVVPLLFVIVAVYLVLRMAAAMLRVALLPLALRRR